MRKEESLIQESSQKFEDGTLTNSNSLNHRLTKFKTDKEVLVVFIVDYQPLLILEAFITVQIG